MVFAPIILWITDFEEKAKLLGIKKAGGKTKNSCIECTQTRDDWIINNGNNIILKDNLYYKKYQGQLKIIKNKIEREKLEKKTGVKYISLKSEIWNLNIHIVTTFPGEFGHTVSFTFKAQTFNEI
ncbi:hypothetical protein M0813_18986 [Anaeramoeba flamelloides]|uniref:Uncharacterized protein n=1 Tax=Anaeramoeba flamelloides TaxID=1746091 RepID=A0ABQ8YS78_9EUKA|nr:hypothetical protein M0813_18986 [Anaeramoeba flamelloides]